MTETEQQQNVPAWVSDPDSFDPERAWNTIENLQRSVAEKESTVAEMQQQLDNIPTAEQLRQRETELEQQIADKQAEELNLRIAVDAQNRGIADGTARDIHMFIDKGLWQIDSNAAFADLAARKPYLFGQPRLPQPMGYRW